MESEDDPDLKRIQKMLEEQGDSLSAERRPEALGDTTKRATPASAYGDGRSFAERARETTKRIGEMTAQTRRDQVPASVAPSAAPPKAGTRLKELKNEANLTWDTIAQEAGISRRWLLEISAGAAPGAETAKSLGDYFSLILKRPVRF